MALPGDATDLTGFQELVPTEWINTNVLAPNLATPTYLAVAWNLVVPQGEGSTVAIPRYAAWTPTAGNKTEAAAFARVEMTTAENTVSAGVVGAGVFVSRELTHDQVVRGAEQIVGNAVRGMVNRVDSDGLGGISSATNTADHGDVALTTTLLINDQATFRGQNPNADRLALLLSEIQFRDLRKSMDATTAANFGNDARSSDIRTLVGTKAGFRGMWEDLEVYVSTNIPTAASKDEGAIVAAGEGGALVYCSWQPITVDSEPNYESHGWDFWLSARYGVGISNDANMLEIKSSDD